MLWHFQCYSNIDKLVQVVRFENHIILIFLIEHWKYKLQLSHSCMFWHLCLFMPKVYFPCLRLTLVCSILVISTVRWYLVCNPIFVSMRTFAHMWVILGLKNKCPLGIAHPLIHTHGQWSIIWIWNEIYPGLKVIYWKTLIKCSLILIQIHCLPNIYVCYAISSAQAPNSIGINE